MTLQEKIEIVQTLLSDEKATDSLVTILLNRAGNAIRGRMYPFAMPKDENGDDVTFEVPEKYEYLQCDLAVRYFSRMGGEGESSHSENGIARSYDSTNDEDLLMEIMQVVV